MASDNSPLESLTAFAMVFIVGVLTTISFAKYIDRIKRNAQRAA
jgi:multisubunit Na+/H+ antiporter MnhF subunit